MKVLELLDEIDEIVETSSGFPLTGKIMVDAEELTDIVKDIRQSLPDEIKQAQWIKNERDRILAEAKTEYETIIKDAQTRADDLVNESEIMARSREQAEELMNTTESNSKQLKMSTYDYVDGILFDFQEKMAELQDTYFKGMFAGLEKSFAGVNNTLATNREEIKEMAYRTTMNLDRATDVQRPIDSEEPDPQAPDEVFEGTGYEDEEF